MMNRLNDTKGEVVLKSGIQGSEKLKAYKMAVAMLKTTGKRKAIVIALNSIFLN
jgi:hypothetical protein